MVRLSGLALLSVMMTGVGAVLAIGGRPEAIIPLFLGAMAIFQTVSQVVWIYRDLTSNR